MKTATSILAAAALVVVAAQGQLPVDPNQWCKTYTAQCMIQSNETCGGAEPDGKFNSVSDCAVGMTDKGVCTSYRVVCRCSIINGPPKDIAIPALRKTFDATNGTCKNLGEGNNVTSPVVPTSVIAGTVTATSSPTSSKTSGAGQQPTSTPPGSSASTTLLSLTAASVVSAIVSALFL